MREIKKLRDVVDWHLCIGCGACAYICPRDRVQLVDFLEEGIRPVLAQDDCGSCRECLDVCPSVETDFRARRDITSKDAETTTTVSAKSYSPDFKHFERKWGKIEAIWEGHAEDPEIRFRGSSGGALTAIATYCLEEENMHGVLHVGKDPNDPLRNRTRLSRSRDELLQFAGSRYSPASVCNGLNLVQRAPSSCVLIGKPAEISAIVKACGLRPKLERNVGVTLSFFCAETPSTRGTIELLEALQVDPESVGELRYRGFGWPGHFAPTKKGESEPSREITYQESWAFLQRYRPWSVHLWPDGSGELADISCGDPWYESPDGRNPGSSLVIARTEKGRKIVEGAIAAGYLVLHPAEAWKLEKSQENLLSKKSAVWGRLLAMRIMGLPVPKFKNANLFVLWRQLSGREKAQSFFGTIRRIYSKKLRTRLELDSASAVPIDPIR